MLESLEKLLRNIFERVPETTEVIVAQNPRVRQGEYPLAVPSNIQVNDILAVYNVGIPELVEKLRAEGKHVSYVNLWNTIQSTDELDELGMQPNLAASERIAQAWFEKIMEIIEQQE